MSGLEYHNIINSINIVVEQNNNNCMDIVKDYDVNNVSKKVVRCIMSYTEYINRNVWRKMEEC